MFVHCKLFLVLLFSIFFISGCTQSNRSENDTDTAFPFYSRAVEQYQQQNYYQATTLINEAIKRNDRTARYYVLKGDILQAQGLLETSLTNYDKALLLQSFNPEVLIKEGHLFYRLKRYPDAIKEFKKAFAQQPENPDILLVQALCYLQMKEHTISLNLLSLYETQVIKQKSSRNKLFYVLKGKVSFEINDFKSVVDYLSLARQIAPFNRNEAILYLRALIHQNEYEIAYALATKELKNILKMSDIHFIRGLYYLEHDNSKDAQIQLEKCVEDKSEILECYNLLLGIYQRNNETDKANILKTKRPSQDFRLINIGVN